MADGSQTRSIILLSSCVVAVSYFLQQLRKWQKMMPLPSASCFGRTHWLFGDFGFLLYYCPRVPRTENRPDLIPCFQQAAVETEKEGLFRLTFFHWLFPMSRTMVIVHDLDLVKELLSKESWGKYKKGESYRVAEDLIGHRGLLASSDTELWRWQRRLLSRAFRRHLFDSVLAPAVRQGVKSMAMRWEQLAAEQERRPVVDFSEEALRLTIGVLGAFAFGFDFEAASTSNLALHEAFAIVLRRMTTFGRNPLLFLTRHLPTEANKAYWEALRAIDKAALAAIDRRSQSAESGDDLLGHILAASEEGKMDRQLILENLRTFLFAGHDTTASALSWALHLLATHPEELELLRKEFRSFNEELMDCDALDRLPRLEAIVREVLRLYPSAGFTREPIEDTFLGKHRLPRGTEVFVFPYILHRDERHFLRADRFEPARWLSESGSLAAGAAESAGWMPFSLGARNCIGSQLAKLEMKLALKELLQLYDFEAVTCEGPPRVVLYMTLVPNYMHLVPLPRA